MTDNRPESSNEIEYYRILFVSTSSNGGSWSKETGLWLDELAVPYYIFQEVGYDIQIASIKGGLPPIDLACYLSENLTEESTKFLNDESAMNKFHNTKCIDNIKDIDTYGCIFLCGGHGAVVDFPNNLDLKRAVEVVYNVCVFFIKL